MTLRTLNYGNYGIFLIMGNAGFCPSTVVCPHSPLVLVCRNIPDGAAGRVFEVSRSEKFIIGTLRGVGGEGGRGLYFLK